LRFARRLIERQHRKTNLVSKIGEILSDDFSARPSSTVLVVEDEDLLRLTVAEYLRDGGFYVLEACSGDEAIDILAAEDRTIDIVFSDIRMPGSTDGFVLARWVRAHKPSAQVILTSGYIGEDTEAAKLGPPETLLQKPYRYSDLLRRVQVLVDAVERVEPRFGEHG
jgi:CheY-like chemotaxis protein